VKRLSAVCCALACLLSVCAEAADFAPRSAEDIKKGAALYAQNCAACHGARMADPEGAFDLRTFPPDQPDRFVRSVTNGKNNMPPWGGLLSPEDIRALWAYVVAGEKN
jgi:mono/diheme cytochrome c family protein